MRAVGIVAEYNPFHRGHQWHIDAVRAAFPGAAVLCVMSGNFVQRGAPAIAPKHSRAEAAVRCGADVVFELPAAYSLAPAPVFAERAVALLSAAGVAGALSFGSECGDAAVLQRAADPAYTDPALVRAALDAGLPYAAAAAAGLPPELRAAAASPNNLLGIEYCRAARRHAPDWTIHTIQRVGARHDNVSANASHIHSAADIRARALQGVPFGDALPPAAAAVLEQARAAGRFPVQQALPDHAVLALFRRMDPDAIAALPEVTEGLEHRISRAAREAVSAEDFFARLKTRRYTMARLRRIACAAYIGLTRIAQQTAPPYLRVLACSDNGKAILRSMRQHARLPVVTRAAAVKTLSADAARIGRLEARADDLYALLLPAPAPGGAFYTQSPFMA